MSKIRVYNLAKMFEMSNTEMVDLLTEIGVSIKSHMSSIDEEVSLQVEEELKRRKEEEEKKAVEAITTYPVVKIKEGASISDVAASIGEKPGSAVKILMSEGLMVPATAAADERILEILGKGFEKHFVFGAPEKQEAVEEKHEHKAEKKAEKHASAKKGRSREKEAVAKDPSDLPFRPPIITVMGHVDHGKTTLLDYIRKTRVTEKEAGGITQHIGASRVNYEGNTLVFLDTPGHEAFTSMRARGAQVTDIAILVVAADDGLMPQTIEAMNHAKAAGVPIVVAVNKIDKPAAKPERVRQQLSDYGLVPEEWGGDTIMVDVAAKTGLNVDQLLEMVLLVAEMQELKADPNAAPEGTVIEANLDKGNGPVATVIVQNGTLRRGNIIYTDTSWGKIRAMIDDSGRNVDSAGPSMPVEILGLENVPQPGEKFAVIGSEREARDIMSHYELERREQEQGKSKRLTLEELYEKMQTEEVPQLRIVLKTDVQGSLEAFHSSLMKMSTEAVTVNIVHEGVGRISESDVMLASASNAIIVGFNVRPDSNAKKIAENEGVQIRLYQVIYDMLDDVRAAMEGMLAPELRENTLGTAEIREIFRVPKIGNIAGCRVMEGLLKRSAKVRLIRDGVVFWNGDLSSLKHFKDDVREIRAGNECGLSFDRFQDFRVGDVIEAYEIIKEKKTLD
jgi:translation initiation factor IF-2